MYLLAHSVATLILARLMVGAGEGSVYTAGATWTVDLAPAHRRGLALGLFGLAVWGGLSLGPVAGELLRSGAGYNAVWVLTAVLPLIGAVIATRLPEPRRVPPCAAGPARGCRERHAGRGLRWLWPTWAMRRSRASWCSTCAPAGSAAAHPSSPPSP